MVDQAGARWSMRFPNLWFVQGTYAEQLGSHSDFQYRIPEAMKPAERWCFERLGALPRTFRLDDADRVCDSAPWWRTRTQILLDGLVRKSLLTVRHRGGGLAYAMLRTVHQFAAMLHDDPVPG